MLARKLAVALVMSVVGIAPIAAIADDVKPPATTVTLSVDPSRDAGRIDERVYGHFLEHIYHSCNGGLWGDIVWNRSFEECRSKEIGWRASAGELVSPADARRESRFVFIENWRDYEFSVEAMKTAGDGDLLILFREDGAAHCGTLVLGKTISLEISGHDRRTRKSETATLATAPGSIDKGQWLRIRVRCERYRAQIWLDDKPILDITDKTGFQRGGIGVGTRHAQGRFRNLAVKSLDGAPLLTAPTPSPARHWRMFGPGDVMLSDQSPLNGKNCVSIRSESGETGISQSHICLHKGDTLRGSVWAKGSGAVIIRLGGQDQALPALGDSWKEYPLEFTPVADEPSAMLQIFARGQANVFIDQVSLTPDSARAAGGFRPDLLQAVKDLKPRIIRWPGGSFVHGYHWKDGIGPQSKRVGKKGWDEFDPLSLGIDEFIALCRLTGAEPLICVDARLDTPEMVQDACDFIEYCNGSTTTKWGAVRAANGHANPYNIKQWEIGNELWGAGAANYVAIVRQFAPSMKKADPSIQLSVVGSSSFNLEWNADVIAGCAELFDYLSIHHYEHPTAYATGPGKYADFWRQTAKCIAASKNPRIKLFVSEWNAQSTDWQTGLYCGGILNEFERNADIVAMATPALWLRHVSEVAWDNAFINFDSTGWFPAPNYVVMKLWREHFAATRVAMQGDAAPINAIATRSDDGRRIYIKAVNPSDQPATVKITLAGGFTPARATLQLVAPDDLKARNTMAQPNAIRPTAAKVEIGQGQVQFMMPRWSAGVVEIER